MKRAGLDLVRGVLIGTAEVVPGVSGGTIALITGVYDTLIGSAATIVKGVVGLASRHGRKERLLALGALPWSRLVLILAGMAGAVIVAARILEPLIHTYPEHTRGVFAGLILVSLLVPLRMVGRLTSIQDVIILLGAALVAFVVTGLPPTDITNPAPWLIVLSAALAVCALILPGVSGSFLLVGIGLYEPTIAAVNDRNLGYLGLFVAGALLGLSSFVVVLQWLLLHFHRVTLIIMAGLMAGSLRALWPWQTEGRGLLPPAENWPAIVALFIAGMAIVATLITLENRVSRQVP